MIPSSALTEIIGDWNHGNRKSFLPNELPIKNENTHNQLAYASYG